MFSIDDFKLSFSSWAAPAQTVEELVETAKASGYVGLELRTAFPGTEPHAHAVEHDMAGTDLADTRHKLADGGIELTCIATGVSLDAPDPEKLIEDLKRYVTLAETLGCRWVRVLGGSLSPERGEVAGAVDAASDALAEAVTFAEQTKVSLLLETHGDYATTKYVREVVKQVYSDHFGVLWDIVEPFRVLETMEEAYDNIGGQVKHVHVHDIRYAEGRSKLEPAIIGEGTVPIGTALKYLAHDGYEGYLSVETLLGPPEDVLPQCAKVLHDLIGEAFPEPADETEEAEEAGGEAE